MDAVSGGVPPAYVPEPPKRRFGFFFLAVYGGCHCVV